jgi:signal transduction histidine kinase
VAVAAHELLTPVTIVRGYSQALQRLAQRAASESPDGESVTLEASRLLRSVERVDLAGERLTRLIGDLLDVSRLERGSLAAEPRPMNLSTLVRSVVDGLRVQQAEGRYQQDLELEVHLPEDGDVSGTWDPTRLEQVLFNVLDNAMKYSLAGGRIELRLRVEHGEAQIIVSDRGLGIEADELEAIFEPFYRAQQANQQAAGFGMGLAVCREIVERHGGSITAVSEGRGRGTTFTIKLPGAHLKDDVAAEPPAHDAAAI